MKFISLVIVLLLFSISNAQNSRIKSGFNSCTADFYYQRLFPMFGRSFVEDHFKMDSTNSYFNYIDYRTNESYLKVGIESSDTITSVPSQYVLMLDVMHKKQKIGSVRVDCHYQDNLIRADKWEGLKDYLMPQIKVIEGQVISFEKALEIAKKTGFDVTNLTEWNIDFEKKKGSNDYQRFFPRLIWTLEGEKDNDGVDIIEINAKNGRIIKRYIKYTITK